MSTTRRRVAMDYEEQAHHLDEMLDAAEARLAAVRDLCERTAGHHRADHGCPPAEVSNPVCLAARVLAILDGKAGQ